MKVLLKPHPELASKFAKFLAVLIGIFLCVSAYFNGWIGHHNRYNFLAVYWFAVPLLVLLSHQSKLRLLKVLSWGILSWMFVISALQM